ncbi:MAG: ThuA domain-containing protein [Pseudomonadota bacterium]
MARALILSGGIFHPFDESSAALAEIFAEVGLTSEVTADFEAGLSKIDPEAFDLVAVNALRWGMMTGDKYEPYRDEWAFQMPDDGRRRLVDFVEQGGALFGLHTASICFDDWPEWGDLLGGAWAWGVSHHPPLATINVSVDNRTHPITSGVGGFEVEDEIYHHLSPRADVEVLLTAQNTEEGRQPIAWVREQGRGRVVYDALGHDGASLRQADHRTLIRNAARWALNSGR